MTVPETPSEAAVMAEVTTTVSRAIVDALPARWGLVAYFVAPSGTSARVTNMAEESADRLVAVVNQLKGTAGAQTFEVAGGSDEKANGGTGPHGAPEVRRDPVP